MNLFLLIIGLLGMLPPYSRDLPETKTERDSRRYIAAQAIAEVSLTPEDSATLLALGRLESAFARYVAEGCAVVPKGAPHCDYGKARSYWQLHRGACPVIWDMAPGTREEVTAAADCALRRYKRALKTCGSHAGAFSGYRLTGNCHWEEGKQRAELRLKILGKIR